jgi:hypothetical protein
MSGSAFSNSWHLCLPAFPYCQKDSISFYLFAESGLDRSSGCAGHDRGAVDAPSSFSVFSAHKVSAAGTPVFDLAAGCNFDSFT